tara:strand:- start:1805 stop:2578 length:774 start_codon:yes stop_codon:yes gene_type:complete
VWICLRISEFSEEKYMKNDIEIDDYDEHPEDDEPEREDEALFGSANFEFSFGEGKEVPTAVYIVAGLIIMVVCGAIFTYTEGFGVMDEWNSKDWVKVDSEIQQKHFFHDTGQRILSSNTTWVWNYTVDGVLYEGEWVCYNSGSNRQPACFRSVSFYSHHQVAYNPDNPSESDLHPGFTRQIFWESVHFLGLIGLFALIGLGVTMKGLSKMLGISLPGSKIIENLIPKPEEEDEEEEPEKEDDSRLHEMVKNELFRKE